YPGSERAEARLGLPHCVRGREREEGADDGLGELAKARLVVARWRNSGEPADHSDRYGGRELAQEIENLSRPPAQRCGETLDHLVDLRLHAPDGARCEGENDEPPDPRMRLGGERHRARVVGPAQHRPLRPRLVALPGAPVRRDVLRVVEEPLHVVVAGDGPKTARGGGGGRGLPPKAGDEGGPGLARGELPPRRPPPTLPPSV